MAEKERFHVERAHSEPVELSSSKQHKRRSSLNTRIKFAGTVDRILGSSRPLKSGKSIARGRPYITVGPVIGKVTHNSARVLVEIDRSASITAVLEPEKHDTRQFNTKSVASRRRSSLSLVLKWRSHQLKQSTEEVRDEEETEAEKLVMDKEFTAGRPGVFHFTNLKPGTKYNLSFEGCHTSVQGSFRTLEVGSRLQSLNVGVISCNNVYITRKAIPIHSDLWAQLYKSISSGKVDYLLHIGDQIYADVEPEDGGGPDTNQFEAGKLMLEGLTPPEWEQKKEKICELYRNVYRDTWQHLPTAKCLANCPNLMILDDHEIRDNWGDVPQDWNRHTPDFFVARCGWLVYLEYQRQLYEDVDMYNVEDIHKDYHFHVLGGIGLMFVDIRASRTFHRVEGDENPYLGTQQWKDITESLSSPGGIFNGVGLLMLCATAPLVFLEPVITNIAAKRVDKLEDFKGHWSAEPHAPEQIRMIDSLVAWKDAQAGREVLILGGDVHCGGHSDVIKDNRIVFQQLTSSAIANMALPKTAYYFMRLVGRLGGTLRTGYTFSHYHWTRSRNFGLIHVKIRRLDETKPNTVKITTQLVKGKFMRGILVGAKVTNNRAKKKRKKPVLNCWT